MLRGLKYAAREAEDSHGKALYMCCCLDMILEAGEFTRAARISFFLFEKLVLEHCKYENGMGKLIISYHKP